MDARRLQLYELLKPKLDEEPARQLVLALAPNPDELATKADLQATKADLLATTADLRTELVALEGRQEARFERLENVLTRRMITIMGAWTLLVGSTIGWIFALAR